MRYEIIGIYHGRKEVIDTAETEIEADYLRDEYALAFGLEWTVYAVRSAQS